MNNKIPFLLFLSLIFLSLQTLYAQKVWTKVEKASFATAQKEVYQKKNFPVAYEIVRLDTKVFTNQLKGKSKQNNIINLPNAEGSFSRFSIQETSNFDEELQAKFPSIKSYSAQGLDDETAVAKISVGTDGFHAVIFSGKHETVYLDPYTKDKKEYIVYKRSSLPKAEKDFQCQVEETVKKENAITSFARNANDSKLRIYRLALVCSGEYAQFHLGANQQNVPDSATDAVKKAAVLSAMNTSLTRLNGVFERDLAVRMVLVGNNDEVIFLDPETDGITDGDANTMINEVQTIADSKIGDANYDIGHIFSVGGAGLAGLGVVCIPGQKARGVTGIGSPVGDPYDIDYVAHEIGHQFGATHTQHNDCNRSQVSAVETGSGSTIMGYAGICPPNVQQGNPNGNSDDYFHAVSIAQMWNIITTSGNCATLTNTNNNAPTANAGLDVSIPKSTPFKLSGTANDVDGLSSLTYNWEQMDKQILDDEFDSPKVLSPLNVDGPMFRSFPALTVPVRYMPKIETVIAGNTSSTWEVVPEVAREMNFSFLVRDNHAGGGGTARDDVKITVVDAEPFEVISPNTAVLWNVGSTQTITWNKGTTDVAPINCSVVNIKLSVDGGLTFPITLKTNTPNDGTENIIIPNYVSKKARIMVEAADNIFYNMNSTNFTVNSTEPTFVMENLTGVQNACDIGDDTTSYSINFDFVNGFSETVTLSATDLPTGATVTFDPATINDDGAVVMTVANLNGATAQNYTLNVQGSSNSINQTVTADLKVLASSLTTVTLTSPTDGANTVSLTGTLTWAPDANATSYDVEIASDAGFTNIVSSGNVLTNSYVSTNLTERSTFYWRVKPKNECAEGIFSEAFSFATTKGVYCDSKFTDSTLGTEFISNVTFGDINNDSGKSTTDGYQNFTSINTNVTKEQTLSISVTFNPDGYQDQCYVFIDWNQDFVFDKENERYDLGLLSGFSDTLTKDITIPANAKLGKTRMRVSIEYHNSDAPSGDGPCTADHNSDWGETEDYSITVDAVASVEEELLSEFKLFPNPSQGDFVIQFNVFETNKVSVELYDLRGRLIGKKDFVDTNSFFSERIQFQNTSAGLYLLRIKNGGKQITKKLLIN